MRSRLKHELQIGKKCCALVTSSGYKGYKTDVFKLHEPCDVLVLSVAHGQEMKHIEQGGSCARARTHSLVAFGIALHTDTHTRLCPKAKLHGTHTINDIYIHMLRHTLGPQVQHPPR